jgi:formylmethanofuran dehydrogenase subunit A
LFLLTNDPWRVFFTTDHPNGAPFTTYPDILALLMDRDLRAAWLSRLPKDVLALITLPSIAREYTLFEVATMTRAAPARLLGLSDRGHLGSGAVADIAVYTPDRDKAKMFRNAALVFKNGELIVQDGGPFADVGGCAFIAQPGYDDRMERRMRDYYDRRYGIEPEHIAVSEAAVGADPFSVVPCSQ